MKQLIAIVGSPRNEGNTAVLLREVLRGAADAGTGTQLVFLNDLTYRGCQGCYNCRTAECCMQRDDLTPILYDIAAADAIVLGSPNYMGQMTGQLKLMLDRFCGFMNLDFSSRLAQGKHAALVFTQGQPNAEVYAPYYASVAQSLAILGFTGGISTLIAPGVNVPGEVAKHEALMAQAHALGRRLAE